MTITVPMTEAKSHLSELVSKVIYGGDRIVLTKHGKVVAEISPPQVTEPVEERDPDDWVWKVAGAFEDDQEFCDILDLVVAERGGRMPREVPSLEDLSNGPA